MRNSHAASGSGSRELDDLLIAFERWKSDSPGATLNDFVIETGLSDEVSQQLGELLAIAEKLPFESKTSISPGVPNPIGPYHIRSLLGQGGMGSVWLASQFSPLRREVAKLIRADVLNTAALARFDRERQALERLEHPNIARILDASLEPQPFIVMEYVRGVSLNEYCDRTSFEIESRLDLFLQLCSAVEFAHHQGILHRDLKPSNILICDQFEKPVAKLIDFGLARIDHSNSANRNTTSITREFTAIGSLHWMSPEQAQGGNQDSIDHRTDIFSLGVVLYWLLTGTTPIEWDETNSCSPQEFLQRIRHPIERPSRRLFRQTLNEKTMSREPESLQSRELRRGSIRKDLDWIALKALAFDPNQRYQRVADLSADVQRYLGRQAVSVRQSSWAYEFGFYKAAAKKFALPCLLFLLGVLFFVFRPIQPDRPYKNLPGTAQLASTVGRPSPTVTAVTGKAISGISMFNQLLTTIEEGTSINDSTQLSKIIARLEQELPNEPASEYKVMMHAILALRKRELGLVEEALEHQNLAIDLCEELEISDVKLVMFLWESKIMTIIQSGDYLAANAAYQEYRSQFGSITAVDVINERARRFIEFRLSTPEESPKKLAELMDLRNQWKATGQWGNERLSLLLSLEMAIRLQQLGNYQAAARILEEDRIGFEQHFPAGGKSRLEFEFCHALSTARPTKDQIDQALAIFDKSERLLGMGHPGLEYMKIGLCFFLIRGMALDHAKQIAEREIKASIEAYGILHSKTLLWHRNWAGVLSTEGSHEESARHLEHVAQSLGKELPARFHDWAAFVSLAGQEWLLSDEPERTIRLVNDALSKDRRFAFPKGNLFFDNLRVLRARAWLSQSKFEPAKKAIGDYCSAMRDHMQHRDVANSLVLLAQAHFGLQESAQAKTVLEERIELGEKSGWDLDTEDATRSLLFDVLMELREFQDAIEFSESFLPKLRDRAPRQEIWQLNRMEACCRNGQYQPALAYLSSRSPNADSTQVVAEAQARLIQGLIDVSRDDRAAAIEHFEFAERELNQLPSMKNSGLLIRCRRDAERCR